MFISISYVGPGNFYYLWDTILDCHKIDVRPLPGDNTNTIESLAVAILRYYRDLAGVNVAKNIALFYLSRNYNSSTSDRSLNIYKDRISSAYPGIRFDKKYHPCIIRQMKMLEWARRVRPKKVLTRD